MNWVGILNGWVLFIIIFVLNEFGGVSNFNVNGFVYMINNVFLFLIKLWIFLRFLIEL